jgi:hypothetical protein
MRHLICLLILLSGILRSQDSIPAGKRIKFSALNLKIGIIGSNEHRFTVEDFDKLSPTPFTKPLPGINTYEQPGRTYFSGGATCSFRIYDQPQKKFGPHEFHLSIFFQAKDDAKLEMNDRQQVRFDTLYSSQTGNAFFVDTLKYFGYEYTDTRNNFLIELGYSLHTRQDRVLSLYTGINVGYGRHLMHRVTKKMNYREEYVDQKGNVYDYPPGQNAQREINNSTSIPNGNVISAAIPIGGMVRFARPSKNSVSRWSFNFELMGGMRYEEIPALGAFTSAYWNLNISLYYFFSSEPLMRNYRKFFNPFQ